MAKVTAERFELPRQLKARIRSKLTMGQAVKDGLPTSLVDVLVRRGVLSAPEVERLVIPRRTLAHRRQQEQRLSPDESDRLARVLRIIDAAEDTFQDAAKAHTWLRRPNRALGGQPPIELLDTDGGAGAVEDVLGRIAHGIVG